jgi:hypothetical protein
MDSDTPPFKLPGETQRRAQAAVSAATAPAPSRLSSSAIRRRGPGGARPRQPLAEERPQASVCRGRGSTGMGLGGHASRVGVRLNASLGRVLFGLLLLRKSAFPPGWAGRLAARPRPSPRTCHFLPLASSAPLARIS